ncbi:PR-1-like protein [Xylariaceae sp. FL0662B]|nr:PR-1-like protein [Xylariaceae sp. FL0662B]
MKSSIFIAACSAALAVTSPLEKRKMETSVVMNYVTVTVTGSEESESAKPTVFWGNKHRPVEPEAEETTTVESTPTQTPTQRSVVVVTETAQPEVQPQATQPVPEVTTEEAAPKVTASAVVSAGTSATESDPEPTEPADDDFANNAVFHHNIHRVNHTASLVTWDPRLAGYAATSAAKCNNVHDMTEGDADYGQNLATWGTSEGAQKLGEVGAIKMAATDQWYNGEFNKYLPNFYTNGPDMSTFEEWGHISQMLWKSTERIGCAAQFCPKGSLYDEMDAWYMVCNYGPPGNINGGYIDNVLSPLGKAAVVV